MNFNGIDFSVVPDNSFAYIAFDLEYGFRLLEERRDLNAVYFRDLNDADSDGINNTPITTNAIVVKSNIVDYAGSFASLENDVGDLVKIGDTWATILAYNSDKSITVDNYPTKLPPVQAITPGTPGIITVPLHGLANNTPIRFAGNNLPIGITASTTYYVRNPSTNSFNISTTSGGASIALTTAGIGEVYVSRLYSVFTTTLNTDKIKDTIIGKVNRQGSTFTVESYYDVSGETITTLELVTSIENLVGDYEGQIVLNSTDNQVYTWNGSSWIIGTGLSARSVTLSVTKQAFEYSSAGNLVGTPTSTIVATPINATGAVTYDFKVDGVSSGISASAEYTYTPNALFSEMPDVISVEMYEDGELVASDLVTMYGVLDGSDAITAILSNEAHTVPASSNGDVTTYSGSGTRIQVYRGNAELQYVTGTPGAGEFAVSANGSNITPGSITAATSPDKYAIVADHSAMSADTATVTYTINVENSISTIKVQSITKSKQGEPGSLGVGAAAVKLDATTYVITYNADGTTPSPSGNLTLTAEAQNIDTPWFKFTGGGAGFDESIFASGSGNTKTKTFTIPSSYFSTPYKFRVDVSSGDQTSLAFDSINVLAVKPGVDAIVGLLTNENHTVTANSDGTGYSLGTAGGTFLVYDGITNVTTSATFSVVGTNPKNGLTISIGSDGTYNLSGDTWTSNAESFTLRASYSGVTIDKIYTISKSLAGTDGDNAQYVVVSGEQAFKFPAGSSIPINTSITLTAQLYGGLTAYNWQYWNGSTWINLGNTTSTFVVGYADEEWSTDVLRVRCVSGAFSDEITIVKIYDGIDGADGADGAAGTDAKTVKLTSPIQAVEYNSADNRVGPSSILFTATPQNAVAPTYRFFINDVVAQESASSTFTYNTPTTYFSAPVKIEVELYDSAVLVARDQVTVFAVKPGSDVLTAILSNEAHTVPTDPDGNNGNFTGSGTTIRVFEGTTPLTYVTGTGFPTINDRFMVVPSASFIAAGSITGSGTTTATVLDASNMTADTASITYTINVRNSVGQNITLTKVQTFSKSKAGVDGVDGDPGIPGTAAVSGYLTNESQALFTYANGIVVSYAPATGSFVIVSGNTDISSNFTLSTASNPQNLTVNYTNRVYTVSGGFDANEDTASLTIRATGSGAYAGVTLDKVFSLSKVKGGYEIVNSLPGAGDPRNFIGSVVFLTTDSKLYRYNGSAWVASVPAVDITGQLTAAQVASLAASQITGQLSDAQIASIAAAKLTGQIVGTQITDGAITTAKILAGSVTSAQIAADTITAANIAANAITASELAAGSVNASKIVAGSITAAQIATDTITANNIAANAITASELNANAVTADKISAGAVTAAKIAVTELSAISATIGTLRTATTGARTEIKDNLIEVYDGANVLRVRLGIWT